MAPTTLGGLWRHQSRLLAVCNVTWSWKRAFSPDTFRIFFIVLHPAPPQLPQQLFSTIAVLQQWFQQTVGGQPGFKKSSSKRIIYVVSLWGTVDGGYLAPPYISFPRVFFQWCAISSIHSKLCWVAVKDLKLSYNNGYIYSNEASKGL